ncbi:MAG: hypothetical protein Q9227_003538 [Pyrenula ochraceoflavens]
MADFQAIAKQFVEFYYKTFDSDRQQLASLYRDASMLTFEANPVQGSAGIVQKLAELPFQKVAHRVDSMDAQPTGGSPQDGIVVLVTGALLVDEEQRPMSYTQMFHLKPDGQTFFVFNDIFRLVYPGQ